jgi:hypothetical protein
MLAKCNPQTFQVARCAWKSYQGEQSKDKKHHIHDRHERLDEEEASVVTIVPAPLMRRTVHQDRVPTPWREDRDQSKCNERHVHKRIEAFPHTHGAHLVQSSFAARMLRIFAYNTAAKDATSPRCNEGNCYERQSEDIANDLTAVLSPITPQSVRIVPFVLTRAMLFPCRSKLADAWRPPACEQNERQQD